IQEFFETEKLKLKAKDARHRLIGDPDANVMPMIAADDVIDPETGEVYLDAGKRFTADKVDKMMRSQLHDVLVIPHPKDEILINSIAEDGATGARSDHQVDSHEGALLKIYQRLRPGNPPQLEKAKELFKEKFQDANRYRLGRVGRFRINRKFDQKV